MLYVSLLLLILYNPWFIGFIYFDNKSNLGFLFQLPSEILSYWLNIHIVLLQPKNGAGMHIGPQDIGPKSNINFTVRQLDSSEACFRQWWTFHAATMYTYTYHTWLVSLSGLTVRSDSGQYYKWSFDVRLCTKKRKPTYTYTLIE